MRNIHIFNQTNDKFSIPFIQFIRENFDNNDHSFILIGNGTKMKFYSNSSIIEPSFEGKGIILLLKQIYQADRIHLHSLFIPKILLILFCQPWLLKKCNWIVWGGDLYSFRKKRKTIKAKVKEFMRRNVIKNMGHITTLVKGDYDFAVKWYGTDAIYHHGIYINPISLNYLDKLAGVRENNKATINIQIGNSADPTNSHIDVLHSLRKFNEANIKIYVPLSYGGSKEYIDKVTEKGFEIFGDKFVPILEFLKPDVYAEYLASIDIAIFNHDRQQGLGNIFALLYLNKKVFIRSDITSWEYINRELGLNIYKVEEITSLDYGEFIMINSLEDNPQKVKKLFQDIYIAQWWNEIFEYKENRNE